MNIKTSLLLFVLLANMLFFSCINKENKTESSQGIKGLFVNNTFLEKISDTIPGGVPSYCLEMNFISADSVDIDNGFEGYKLAYKKDGSNYILLKASWKGDMIFTINRDSSISLMDSAWTGIQSYSEFKKVPENKEHKSVFETYLNEKMIAGEYILYKDNKSTQQKIIFTADGGVTGLEDYATYSLCYSGDCIGETNPVSNYIYFSSRSNVQTDYAFKIDKKNKMLRFFSIAAPIKDIKGDREIKEKVFDLKK